jgi:hypothetical protein
MEKEKFEYSYFAPTEEEKRQVELIKSSYEETDTPSEIKKLKSIDKKVKDVPTVWALVLGIIGTLIFGTGFALVLEFNKLLLGIIIAFIGIIPIALAYPVYKFVVKKLKNKYKDEIIALADEILAKDKE